MLYLFLVEILTKALKEINRVQIKLNNTLKTLVAEKQKSFMSV
jgi:hypothetical protein